MRDLKQWFLASWWCLRWLNASSRRKMSYKNNLDGWLQEWYKLYSNTYLHHSRDVRFESRRAIAYVSEFFNETFVHRRFSDKGYRTRQTSKEIRRKRRRIHQHWFHWCYAVELLTLYKRHNIYIIVNQPFKGCDSNFEINISNVKSRYKWNNHIALNKTTTTFKRYTSTSC